MYSVYRNKVELEGHLSLNGLLDINADLPYLMQYLVIH